MGGRSVAAGLLVASLAACGDGDDAPVGPDADRQCYDQVEPSGTDYQYVISSIVVPTSEAQALALGLDLDGDPQSVTDNAVGRSLAVWSEQETVDVQSSVDSAVATGDGIGLLHFRIHDCTISLPPASLWVFLGTDADPPPCSDEVDTICGHHLTGGARFEIAPYSPTDARVDGDIGGNMALLGQPGRISLVFRGGTTTEVVLNLIGARIQMTWSDSEVSGGRLGGAIVARYLATEVLPDITNAIAATLAQDCPGLAPDCCTADSAGQSIVDLFDADLDCRVTQQELEDSDLIRPLLEPDLDLLDEDGNFNPRVDGIADSISLGFGFTAVSAFFPAPPQ